MIPVAWINCEFVVIDRNREDKAFFLTNKGELNEWLNEGSLEQGDYVVEIKKLWKVERDTTVKRYLVEAKK